MKEIPQPEELKRIDKAVNDFSHGDQLTSNQIAEIRYDLSRDLFNITRIGGYLDKLQKRAALLEVWAEKTKAEAYVEGLKEGGSSSTKADKLYRKNSKWLAAYHSFKDAEKLASLVRDHIRQGNQVLNSMASKLQN